MLTRSFRVMATSALLLALGSSSCSGDRAASPTGVSGSGGALGVAGSNAAGGGAGAGGAGSGSGGQQPSAGAGGTGGSPTAAGGGGEPGASGAAATGGAAGAGGAAGIAGAGGAGGTAGAAGAGGTAGAAGASGAAGTAGSGGSGGPTSTTNLFTTLSGKTQAEVDAKVTTAVHRFFGIGTGEPNTPTLDSGYRCYYELPNDPSMAYIWAPDSNDIRSEGMSYGMMIAVQTDLRAQFDKLWKFAKTHMQYPADTPITPWKHYFRWQGTVTGSTVNFGATTVPAPDGDEYFAAALYLADRRWGSTGTVNYRREADDIAAAMLHNTAAASRYPIIHATQNMIVFVPYGGANEYTDPSYHLPGFYEMFALYGPAVDAAKWRSVADTSRKYLVASAHPTTGLHSDYATFAGAPTTGSPGDGHDQFKYDAWRVVMNMAVDYAWFSQSPTLKAQVEKYHAFFAPYLMGSNVTSSLFHVDGSNASGGGSTALTATLAAGALASSAANRKAYVDALWSVPQQAGLYRYYQESVYLLGLLAASGKLGYDL
jgi:oligosaccharide reducing-end xylanase